MDFPSAPLDIQRQSLLDLVQRGRGGIGVHLILWLLLGATGGVATRTPMYFWSAAAAFGTSMAGRAVFEPRIERLSASRTRATRQVFLALLLVNPLIWGLIGATTIVWSASTLVSAWLWMVIVGVAASGGMSMAFDPAVRLAYAPLAVLPAASTVLYTLSGEQRFLPVGAVVFLLYIYRASKIVHGDYWAAVQARVELEHRAKLLEHISATDALTQVANRMHFDRQLLAEWARARRDTAVTSALSVIMVDIDHFKRVNDSHGHPFGDRCLQSVAGALQSALARPADLLARFGGEEFVAMLPNTNAAGAAVVSARMQAAIAGIVLDGRGESVRLTCSIGVHTVDMQVGSDPMAAIANADEALYEAKRSGRNRTVVFRSAVAASRAAP